MSLADLMRKARSERGLSLQESADMMGTTKAHLHTLETGASSNPTLRLIAAIVIVYGIRPETLIATVTQENHQ